MGLKFKEAVSYDDVMLVPQKGIVDKRKDVDLKSMATKGCEIRIPILSAPMKSITEWRMARAISKSGGLAIIHRFMTVEEQMEQFERGSFGTMRADRVGCALGIKKEDHDRFERLFLEGCRIFCIDVAHAHCSRMEEFMLELDKYKKEECQFIVGNVGTLRGAAFLEELGADAIKVGIGPGAACTTREVTGFGVPQLSAIAAIAEGVDTPIIADGGIKTSGDIVKALAAGASTVMIGRLLAGTDEAAIPDEYFGMASKKVNGHHAPEGAEGSVERIGPVRNVLKGLLWGIRSGISYGGAKDIKGLQAKAEWIKVGHGTLVETATRI